MTDILITAAVVILLMWVAADINKTTRNNEE